MTTENKTLANIQVGDYVLLRPSHKPAYIDQVVRTTEKQFLINGGLRFWKKDGYAVGQDTWARTTAKIVSEEDYQKFKDQEKSLQLIFKVSRLLQQDLSLRKTNIPSFVIEQWIEVIRSYKD